MSLSSNKEYLREFADQIRNVSECEALRQLIDEGLSAVTDYIDSVIQEQLRILKNILPILTLPFPDPISIVKWLSKLVTGTAHPQLMAYIRYTEELIEFAEALADIAAAIEQATESEVQCLLDLATTGLFIADQISAVNVLIGDSLTKVGQTQAAMAIAIPGFPIIDVSSPEAFMASSQVTVPLITESVDNWVAEPIDTAAIVDVLTGKTFTVSNTMSFVSTDGANVDFGAGGTVMYEPGYTGSKGDIGYTGSASTVVGYTGSQGVGYTGSQGVGYTGSQGVIGYTGSAGSGSGGSTDWIIKTTTYTAISGDKIVADTTSASFTINLPASPSAGYFVYFISGPGSWATNPLTVGRNGSTIEGGTEDFSLNIDNTLVSFIYDGTTWQVTATAGPKGYNGSVGYSGSIGYTGSQGDIGYTGSASTVVGYTGSKGDIGYTGSASTVVGYTGSKGDIGYTGSASTVVGYTGSKGDIGYSGSKGDIGYSGSKGDTGAPGPKSVTILSPAAGDEVSILWSNTALTLAEIRSVVRGTSPTVNATFSWGTSRASGTTIQANMAISNTTNGNTLTSFTNSTPTASSFIWVTINATTGTVSEFHASLRFT